MSKTVMKPLTRSNQSWGTCSKTAALPPIRDQMNGMTRSQRDIGCVVNKNIPNVKMVTGQGVTPNTGISG